MRIQNSDINQTSFQESPERLSEVKHNSTIHAEYTQSTISSMAETSPGKIKKVSQFLSSVGEVISSWIGQIWAAIKFRGQITNQMYDKLKTAPALLLKGMIYVFHLKWNGLSEDDKKRFVSSLAENQEHSSKAFEWAHELGIQYGMYLNSTLEATSDWL